MFCSHPRRPLSHFRSWKRKKKTNGKNESKTLKISSRASSYYTLFFPTSDLGCSSSRFLSLLKREFFFKLKEVITLNQTGSVKISCKSVTTELQTNPSILLESPLLKKHKHNFVQRENRGKKRKQKNKSARLNDLVKRKKQKNDPFRSD